MDNIPAGAIPVDSFQAADVAHTPIPEGAIPVDQFESHENKYSGVGQGIQAGAEGLLKGTISSPAAAALLGPGIDLPGAPGLKTGLNLASPEGIRGRAEEHPIANIAGETAGLVAGTLTGTGEAAALEHIGSGAAKVIGLAEPVGYAARVGSAAVKSAAEMAAFQSSDEIGKMVLQDPDAGAQSAIANIGLAAALGAGGGAFFAGAVNPLWNATKGLAAGEALTSLVDRLGGREGSILNKAAELEGKTGIVIPPEMRAVIDDVPGAMTQHSILSQTDNTIAGRKYQKGLNELHENLGNKVIESLGKSPESIQSLPDLDKYVSGRTLGETLHSEMKPITEEISNRYGKINDQFKTAMLSNADKATISERIAQKSLDEGWHKAESDAQKNLATRVMDSIGKQETVDDVKKYLTNLSDAHPYGSPTYQAAKDIGKIIRDTQEKIISSKMGPEQLAGYGVLRKDYGKLMDIVDGLNEHLHVGRYDGPGSFLKSLEEMSTQSGENVLNRLSGKNRAEILERLQMFPKTLEKVKEFHVDSLLDKAIVKSADGNKVNVNQLIKQMDNLSPQIKALIANPQQHDTIKAVDSVIQALKDPTHNYSNTGRTVAKLANSTPSVLSFIAAMMGHADVGLMSFLGKLGFNEGKDAVKLGMLKFLGSNKEISPAGFKAAASFIDNATKGAKVLSKATDNVFKPGVRVLTTTQMPSLNEIQKLDKLVAANDPKDTDKLMAAQETPIGHYMPEHQVALSQSSLTAIQYLKNLKPVPQQNYPLDMPIEPSAEQEARYHRALEIAQQPAVVLQSIKDGSITPNDVHDLKAMYPAVYNQVAQKLSNDMISHHSKEEPIPYKTRMGLSLFLGQAMDSTMQPMSIIAAQPKPRPQGPQQQDQSKSKGSPSKVGKDNKMYRTPSQASESDRANRD